MIFPPLNRLELIPQSWSQPSCTSLPGSHDELVSGRIQSELGEILGSRVGEVRDPWLQIWGREKQPFGYCWPRGSQLHQHRTQERKGCSEAGAPWRPGFCLPTSVSSLLGDWEWGWCHCSCFVP